MAYDLLSFCIFYSNGRWLHFWEDVWCREETSCNDFPSLFRMATNKDAMVADVWDFSRRGWGWTISFSRPCYVWKEEQVWNLLLVIQRKQINQNLEDKIMLKVASIIDFLWSFFTKFWKGLRPLSYHTSLFGMFGCRRKLIFLLGNPLGGES